MSSALSWPSGGCGGSMRMHVPRFPALNLCERDVRRGAVKVIARSPSGLTQTLKIQSDSSGQFTTNFIPNEVGDWTINVLHDNKNIDGSPFTVGVYDPGRVKVFGLQDCGITGGPVQFSVDTSEAGNGDIEVLVTYDARQMATRVSRAGHVYHVSFMPEGPGVYNIEVHFADMEVQGSPFIVEIASPATATAFGDGLEIGQRGQKAYFMIDTGYPTQHGDISVSVSPPRGAKLPVDITKSGDHVFRAEFIPTVVGDHIIDVSVRDCSVCDSPFVCKVFDNNQIFVSNVPTQAVLSQPVTFGIDASESGNGKLEIMVNNGEVPCHLDNNGSRKFLGTFVPEDTAVHVVRVFFNDVEVPGSPWQIEILSAEQVRTNANELGMLMVNQPASFEIYTDREAEGRLNVNIAGPDCCPLQTTITKKCTCCYEVHFTPRKIGMYQIVVTYEGMLVDGSPYTTCVFDPHAITVCPVDPVACNELVEFTVDANNAGSGELSIVVNNGSVPSTARLVAQNIYSVSFMPTEPGIYTVELFFNCQPLKESPLKISVVDVRLITFSGPLLVPVKKSAVLKANTEAAGKANMVASLTSPTGKDVSVNVSPVDPAGFSLEFMPLEVGPHQLGIVYGGHCPVMEPLTIMAYDSSCIRVMGVKDGLVGCQPSKFIVDLNKCGEGELDVNIMSSSGSAVDSEMRLLEAGRLEVLYSPEEGGLHFAEVMFNSEPVNGSPFQFNVLDPGKVTVRGTGLDLVPVNEPASFVIVAPCAQIQDIDVVITGPTGRQIMPNVTEKRANNFLVEYTPKQPGVHMIAVRYFECCIPDSPFEVQVWDASQVHITNVNQCSEVAVDAFFNVELSDSGDGTVEIIITGPNGQLIPHQTVAIDSSLLEVHYVPMMTGIHHAAVTYNGTPVAGSPVEFKVIDVNKVVVRGDGLGLVPTNRPALFFITAPDAKLSDIDVAITNPAGNELIPKITETSRGNFRVEYLPCIVGTYQIRIAYCCIEVGSSACFIAKAWDACRVRVADVTMSEVGFESSFKVILSEAGEGVAEITLTDPDGHLLPNQVLTAEPGVLEVVFVPRAPGLHRANVVFNGETVCGSPFTFLVIDVSSVSCWGDGLCPVPVCKPVCFYITAPHAKLKDIAARVIAPDGSEVMTRVTETTAGSFRVDYTPKMAGEHFVSAFYFGRPIACCPTSVQAWDISKVLVSPIPMAFVGCESLFTVDATEAGEGKLDVVIVDPNGQLLTSDISTDSFGAYLVSYTPKCAGQHRVDVYFNREIVTGSPFCFVVADPEKVCASGDGLDMVRAGKPATFIISAPAARLNDFSVKITGPSGKPVSQHISESGRGEFIVEYTPTLTGNYVIEVLYFDEPINCSPFTARAWDPAGVVVSNITPGIICEESTFNINAMGAGSGNLEITVTAHGEEVPSSVMTGMHASDVMVSFVPRHVETHLVNIYFNGQNVPGSPFAVPILDGQLVKACGPGLQRAIAGRPASFMIDTCYVGGDAPLSISIQSPSGAEIVPMVEQTSTTSYNVTYIPEEAGCHTINVLYANSAICGSPFCVDVFNPSAVGFVEPLPQCFVIGKPVCFKVDSSEAGNGHLAAKVKAPTTHPPVMITETECLSALSFIPLETGEHLLFVTFDDVNIAGSPLEFEVIDPKSLTVNWDCLRQKRVGEVVLVEVTTDGSAIDDQLSCSVNDPYQLELPIEYTAKTGRHQFSFVPQDVGPHMIDLRCGCHTVVGGPYTCNVYDAMRVRLIDVTECADLCDEVEFTVDTSEAGLGDLDVSVTQSGVGVPVKRNQVSLDMARYSFTAKVPKQHVIHVSFNGENIPGSPYFLDVVNPANKMSLHYGNATTCIPVTQTVWATVNLAGYACFIAPEAIVPIVVAPTGDLLPAKVSQLTNGGIRVEYCSSLVGTHELSVEFGGQLISGSPLITEIVDPSKILLEGMKRGKVEQPMVIDVCLVGAGEAELSITVLDPSGQTIAFDVEPTPNGERVTYIPDCPGTYKINATYCGVNVPGCPIRQEVDAVIIATASGCGLEKGVVDRMAEFVVDVKGETGDLLAEVRGPTSIAHTTIETVSGKNMKVKYLPAEVGEYTIILLWNDNEVDGSPFHPKIIDPNQVEVVVDCPENWTAVDRLMVPLDELYSILFDCAGAGPGRLTATVTGPRGDLLDFDLLPYNTDADNNADMFVLKFLPCCPGDYYIRAYWCDCPIQLFPVIATAMLPEPEFDPFEVRADMVAVTGPGISCAYCHENADFVIDGHEAGPGVHEVKMVGLKCDIDVMCVPIEEGVFGCTYVPEVPGAYLLSVLWSGQHVPGSPFKVSVASTSDASRVVCSGDGLASVVMGHEGSVLIDARAAGPGEVVAQCTGPTKTAYCSLIDRHDGTFELIIKPNEVGSHKLEITYGSEPVPGSPFFLKVTAAPNASMVRVSGDGIKSGLLATYQSTFVVDTRGAGPGQLTVKVRGRKGAFRVEMSRLPGKERSIQCRFYPTEIGVYNVYVLWSGEHVPGSPFSVNIVDTMEQLRSLAEQLEITVGGPDNLSGYGSTRSSRLSTDSQGGTLRGLIFSDDY